MFAVVNAISTFKIGPDKSTSATGKPEIHLTPFARMVYEHTNIQTTRLKRKPPIIKTGQVSKHRKDDATPISATIAKAQVTKNLASKQHSHKVNSLPKQSSTDFRNQPSPVTPKLAVVIQSLPSSHRKEYSPVVTNVASPIRTNAYEQSSLAHKKTSESLLQQGQHRDGSQSHVAAEHLQPSASPSVLKMSVVIPNMPNQSRELYAAVPLTPDTPTHMSRKKVYAENSDEDTPTRGDDKQHLAESALSSFQALAQTIFDDNLDKDADELSSTYVTSIDDCPTLSESALKALDVKLARIKDLGVYAKIPIEDLLRIQRLCEVNMSRAEMLSLKFDALMSEEDVVSRLDHLEQAQLGTRAARMSLSMMLGSRIEKQLYSEDAIQSAIEGFRNITDACIIPVVELRNSGQAAPLFRLLSANKASINRCLLACRKLLTTFTRLVSKIELSERTINSLEFIATRLIFVENALTEKDSVLGLLKYDGLRLVAMDLLAQIFAGRPSLRPGIFNNILTSLEKLPVTKQRARQFSVGKSGNIQLVSALIMLLVQASANKTDDVKNQRRKKALQSLEDEYETVSTDQSDRDPSRLDGDEDMSRKSPQSALDSLEAAVRPLRNSAEHAANYFIAHMVSKAQNSTKSGESPYRSLLELFVEDFIVCLRLPEWPSSELLLYLLLVKSAHLLSNNTSAAPAKNMALDCLGAMVAGISELNSHVRASVRALEPGTADQLGRWLTATALDSLEAGASLSSITAFEGSYRIALEALGTRRANNSQIKEAIGYLTADWASRLLPAARDEGDLNAKDGVLAYNLRMMINNPEWVFSQYHFDPIPERYAELAYATIILHTRFCQHFTVVMQLLLEAMANDQATVRSKSLKSVNQVIETDPSILDRHPMVVERIRDRTNDMSPQVRDSALSLITRCLALRPALKDVMLPGILRCINDPSLGVRKRAMKLAKDVYLETTKANRCEIADALLHRVTDQEESIRDLARQIMQDVWMLPFYGRCDPNDTSVKVEIAVSDHVALMINTVQRSSSVAGALEKIIKSLMCNEASKKNRVVCQFFVARLFDDFISKRAVQSQNDKSDQNAQEAFSLLAMFAKANPELLNIAQIDTLRPYLSNLSGVDDLNLFRSVVMVYRHVLPTVTKSHHEFLVSVRTSLQQTISKITGSILDDAVACLWIIGGTLDDTSQLRSVCMSLVESLQKAHGTELHAKPDLLRKLTKQLLIAGTCGKNCNFDNDFALFQKRFPKWKITSVSQLLTSTFAPFAAPSQPPEMRRCALDAIGMVCQSWPKNFADVKIYTTFQTAFAEKNASLESIILTAFEGYFAQEEKRSEVESADAKGPADDSSAKLGVMGGGHGDGIAISIAQRFLSDIIRISMSTLDEHAFLATRIIASISRQGLVHPKEVGSTLIALETCTHKGIAELAFAEHKVIHQKHETILEKEYIRAVELAYRYQRDVVADFHGATLSPYTAKLWRMVNVMQVSKVKNRRRFFATLCERIDFDPARIEREKLPEHLEFAQFIIENLAFFEYATVDDLLAAIGAMEKVVAGLGTNVAHSIETELLGLRLDQPAPPGAGAESQHTAPSGTDSGRLLELTAYSAMLSILWEARTYLRKSYGLMHGNKDGKVKSGNKDLSKVPTRVQGFNGGDKLWESIASIMSSMETDETALAQCKAFVDLLAVDSDFKLAAEADDDLEAVTARPCTPSDDDEEQRVSVTPGSGKGRKRKGTGMVGTPSGRKKARPAGPPRARSRNTSVGRSRGSMDSDVE